MSAGRTQRDAQCIAEIALRPESDAERRMAESRARIDATTLRLSTAEMGLAIARRDAARRDTAAALSGLFGALGAMITAVIKLGILMLLFRLFFGF